MQIILEIPKMKQSEIADQLGYTSGTLQSYRNDIIMPSPYRIQHSITNKRTKKASITKIGNNSHRENDLKGLKMTSNDLVKPETNNRNKNVLNGGSGHENV